MSSHEDEDVDRERYRELLEELRTIIPGVQVLFAFLLTVPFSSRFTELDDLGIRVFALSILAVALATVVFLTPAAHHRMAPDAGARDRIRLGVRTTLTGMTLLAVSVGAAVFVVMRLIFRTEDIPGLSWSASTIGAVGAAAVAGAAVILWFVVPFVRRFR